MTWSQLGQHRKPILVNIKGFWNPLLAMLDYIRSVGFIHRDHNIRFIVVDRVENIIPSILAAAVRNGAPDEGIPPVIMKM